jgi:glycerate 2-kinase
MIVTIKNKEQLVENGETNLDRKARRLALASLETAVQSVDPERIICSKLSLKDSVLKVDKHSFDLKKTRHVYVVGGGKASGSMAEGLEVILGQQISCGLVNVPHGSKNRTSIIKLHAASHPISGGGSSLMPLPRDHVSISDKKALTDALLKSGANINEINTVRKHISDFKGGWLAKRAYPATILNLILSDVVGDPLDFIASGPTVPDSTTFSDAVKVLNKYGLWNEAPVSIRQVLTDGEKGKIPETPKADDKAFKKVYNVIVGNNRSASTAACEYLKSARVNALLLTASLEGEAKTVGTVLASIANEIAVFGNPVPKPAGIVFGGETTVVVTGTGQGGRNQEIPLGAALRLRHVDGIVVASLSTDGVDGPTDAAGAVVDGKTLAKAQKIGLAPEKCLANNDSYHFFSRLNDLIFTGPTGTNVNDISVIIAV